MEKQEFLSDVDRLFDVIGNNTEQQRRLKKDELRIINKHNVFYDDQRSRRIGKCLDETFPVTSSDQKIIRRSESPLDAPNSSTS